MKNIITMSLPSENLHDHEVALHQAGNNVFGYLAIDSGQTAEAFASYMKYKSGLYDRMCEKYESGGWKLTELHMTDKAQHQLLGRLARLMAKNMSIKIVNLDQEVIK